MCSAGPFQTSITCNTRTSSPPVPCIQAYQYYRCGVQYIVRDGAVVIVDESTGRVRPISRYSGGLHQAIEAKEGVEVKPDSHATASITFQVFFRWGACGAYSWGLGYMAAVVLQAGPFTLC